MGSWWAFCIQKEGLEFGQKMKGIFGLILYEPSWARKRRLYYLWLLSGASKPSQGFSPFLEGKSIFFRKKRKPCLSPHARGFLFCFSNIIWGPGFWNLAFFYADPGSRYPARGRLAKRGREGSAAEPAAVDAAPRRTVAVAAARACAEKVAASTSEAWRQLVSRL